MTVAAIKLLQISDTHLSRSHGYFWENWLALREAIEHERPDFVLHSGDVSFNGPHNGDDIVFARSELDRISSPWRAVAGNHDIGEAPPFSRLGQPINGERINRWRQSFGDQWWLHDVGQWRIIGLDTALMASGLPEEVEQNSFLEHALTSRGDREAMVVIHMPPFFGDPADEAFTTSYIPFPARGPFLDTCYRYRVKVISCGHLHIYHTIAYKGIEIVWGPCTAMVSIDRWLARLNRVPRPGYLVWELEGREARHSFVQPDFMFMIDVTSFTTRHGGSTTKMPARPIKF